MKTNLLLNLLLLISIIIVVLFEIIFYKDEALFDYAFELSKVLSNISLAYIASYIFYLVVVVQKEKTDKKNVYKSVNAHLTQLIGRASSAVTDIYHAAGEKINKDDVFTITYEEFYSVCLKANINKMPDGRMLGSITNAQKARYGMFIYNNAYMIVNNLIDKIFVYMPYLDTELVRLLNAVKDSVFFLVADSLTYQSKNEDSEVLAKPIYDYIQIIKEIKIHYENKDK